MWVRDWISAKIWGDATTEEKKPAVVAEETVDTPEEAATRLQRIKQTAASTAVIGDAILVELDRQDEKIEQIEGKMDHLEHNQKLAAKSIHHLQYGVVEREKGPRFQPKPPASAKQRDTKGKSAPVPATVGAEQEEVVTLESNKELAGLSDQVGRLRLQATLMGGSIKGSHEKLKKVEPRVQAATDKNNAMSKQLQGMKKQ